MSRSEVAVEAMGAHPLEGLPEPAPLYRVVRERGGLPYGGHHMDRVASANPLVGGLLGGFASGLASIETAGVNEGRGRAAFRVTLAGTTIGLLGLLWATAWLLEAGVLLVRWVGWTGWPKRVPPAWLNRGRDGLEWTRHRLGEQVTLRRLSMRRPGRVASRAEPGPRSGE
jgi:hypothetical protein